MSFLREFWLFLRRIRKKYWLLPIFIMMAVFGGLDCSDERNCCCAIYIHAFLDRPMRILGISAFYHDSAAALVEDGESSPRRRKSASAARSTMRAFPRHAIRILP